MVSHNVTPRVVSLSCGRLYWGELEMEMRRCQGFGNTTICRGEDVIKELPGLKRSLCAECNLQAPRHRHSSHVARSPTWMSWRSMRKRMQRADYRNKGTRICERWDI